MFCFSLVMSPKFIKQTVFILDLIFKQNNRFKLLFCTNMCRGYIITKFIFYFNRNNSICFISISLNKHFQEIMIGTHIKDFEVYLAVYFTFAVLLNEYNFYFKTPRFIWPNQNTIVRKWHFKSKNTNFNSSFFLFFILIVVNKLKLLNIDLMFWKRFLQLKKKQESFFYEGCKSTFKNASQINKWYIKKV